MSYKYIGKGGRTTKINNDSVVDRIAKKAFTEVKDSGKRYVNENGGQRDTAEGKINYLLVPHSAMKRVAQHYTNGLKKYGKDNWKLLNTPEDIERFKESADRHLRAYINKEDQGEDHASACIFNIMALIYFEELK